MSSTRRDFFKVMGLGLGAFALNIGALTVARKCSPEPEPVTTIEPGAKWLKITVGDNIHFLPYWVD